MAVLIKGVLGELINRGGGGGGGSLNPGGLYPDKKLRFKTSSNKTLLKAFSRAYLEIR